MPVGEIKDSNQRAQAYREQIAAFAQRNPDQYHSLCFDALFVDEGQDFEPEGYRLLLELIKPHSNTGEKTLIIFYDDAQNLFGKPRPVWRQVVEFAFNVLGNPSFNPSHNPYLCIKASTSCSYKTQEQTRPSYKHNYTNK